VKYPKGEVLLVLVSVPRRWVALFLIGLGCIAAHIPVFGIGLSEPPALTREHGRMNAIWVM